MKTIIKPAIISLLIIVGIALVFSYCHKEKECPAVVTVKLQSDTTQIVAGAAVKIFMGSVLVKGVSDANGQFRNTFKLEAILDINAIQKTDSVDSLYGNAMIRLVPGLTVYKTVFIHK